MISQRWRSRVPDVTRSKRHTISISTQFKTDNNLTSYYGSTALMKCIFNAIVPVTDFNPFLLGRKKNGVRSLVIILLPISLIL